MRECFEPSFRSELVELLAARRDVRRFRSDPIADATLVELIELTRFSPSVGYSQPARYVKVDAPERRAAVIASFERANAAALASYQGERAALYAQLKLSGLRDAPVHLAVFADVATTTGRRLGAKTMPQMLEYSAAMAMYTLWLLARARGIGIGWVSILEPEVVQRVLDVPAAWRLIAYLCIGYPVSYDDIPELRRAGWEQPDPRSISLTLR